VIKTVCPLGMVEAQYGAGLSVYSAFGVAAFGGRVRVAVSDA
jgi:hypothetical protein